MEAKRVRDRYGSLRCSNCEQRLIDTQNLCPACKATLIPPYFWNEEPKKASEEPKKQIQEQSKPHKEKSEKKFFLFLTKKQKISIVCNTSKRLEAIQKINEEIRFDNKFVTLYQSYIDMPSKAQYAKCNAYEIFKTDVSKDITRYQNLVKRAEKESEKYSTYLKRLESVPPYASESEVTETKVRYKTYHKIEADVYEKLLKHPITDITFVYHIRYSSPGGRNFYHKEVSFATQSLYTIFREIEEEEQRKQTAAYQRSLVTPSLRYEILKRDNYRCQICGRDQADGVKLHVDHIVPVSKGGKSVKSNLRTLCNDCNLGKGARYDSMGKN